MPLAETPAGLPRPVRLAVGIKQVSLIGLTLLAIALTGSLQLATQPDPTTRAAGETAVAGQIPVAARNEQKVLDAYGNLPLAFVPNAGQTDALVRFSAQTVGAQFHFTETEAVFAFDKVTTDQDRGVALRLGFLDANPGARIEGQGLLTGKVNYLIGNDPNEWHTNLPTYGQVVYRDLWPGVDMVFRGDASRLKYEFLVRPGARVEDIQLAYRGADRLSLNEAGQLLIGTSAGTLTDTRPLSYQAVGGTRMPVESRFLLHPDSNQAKGYGFAVGHYDLRRPLVIDPGLLYSTYLGGDSSDTGNPVAVDSAGSAYVTGETSSNSFPTTAGAFDITRSGIDAFVSKLNPAGTALVYSTFLGGSSTDQGFGIAVDGSGSAYVTGVTESNNFPTTAGAFDTARNGIDAFVTKLNPTGTAPLVYSTFLGGSNTDRGFGIAVDGSGSAYVTGETESNNFPTTAGAFDTTQNGVDAFVTKLNATGTAPLLYSTYLGGGGADRGRGIALDGAGSAYVTGVTESNNFPTTAGAFDTTQNGVDAFVSKLNPTGTAPLLYSTYLGGSGTDRGFGIGVDASGSAYVTGETDSNNFPTTAGAFDTTQNGVDAFVSKLNPTLAGAASLVYSTYLGGSGADRGFGIGVDTSGSAYVTGETDSSNFPTTMGAFDTTQNGVDAFVTKLNPTGTAPLLYSTYLGGSGADRGFGIDVDGTGNSYVTGRTESTDFPTTTGAFDTTYNSNGDAFVTKLDMIGAPAGLTLSPTADTNPVGTSHTVTATVRDVAGNPVAGVTVRFSVTGANTASGSATTNASGQATFTYTGNNAGLDQIHAFADTNNNGTQNAGEPFGGATKTWTPAAPAMLTLTPATDTNPVGTSHTVTATVTNAAGGPVANVTVRFTVTGSVSTTGQCTTNVAGQCDFTYSGPTMPGADAITAFADTNNNGTQNAGEPAGAAEKTWTPGAPATLTLTPVADENTVGDEHCVTATVRDAFSNPVPGVTVRFSVTGAHSESGSETTDANGEAAFCYMGTTAGADAITAFADTNNNGTQDAGEPFGGATKTWTPGAPATLTLTPVADENTVGDEHCVTATVRDAFGNLVPGVTVRFSVPTSVATFASPSSGADVTDANGEATFCYSASLPGEDTIHAFADTNNNGTQNAGEPFGDATKTWTPPASTELCEVKITQGGWIIANNGDRASFGGNAKVSADGSSVQGQEQYQDHGPAQPRTVHSIELLATTCSEDLTTATIFGTATINGSGTFVFRIDVMDQGEPGTNDSYGIMLSDGYASGQKQLRGGNVTIHKLPS